MLSFTVHTSGLAGLGAKLAQGATRAETIVAQQAMKDTSPFVPFKTGSLNTRARVVGNQIIYPGPYSRYLYYGKVMVNAATGKGPARWIDKDGNEVIRFPYGSHLIPTSRDLVFSTAGHPQAQPFWFEASKRQNLAKWERVARNAIAQGGNNGD